jgi:hypothetical protein
MGRGGRRVRTDADPDTETRGGAGRGGSDAAPQGLRAPEGPGESEGRDRPDASLAVVAPDAGPHRAAGRAGTAEAGSAGLAGTATAGTAVPGRAGLVGTSDQLPLNRTKSERADFDRSERNAAAKPKAAKRVFSTAAGLVLFALGLAAAVGLAYLTGLTIRFFAAGQAVTAALTLAAAAATTWAIWASITRGWHRLRPGT